MSDKARLDALSALITQRLKDEPERPKLRLVTAADFDRGDAGAPLDGPSRAWVIARIHDLRRLYGLDWLIRQETRSTRGSLAALEDDPLRALLANVELAAQSFRDGVPLEDTGLVRDLTP